MIMATPHQINANGVVKTRRSHRKSRNGCSECKRRHIRCDERRPACTNCTIAERLCAFPPPQSQKPHLPPHAASLEHPHQQAQPLPLTPLADRRPQSPADSHLSRHSHHSPSSSEPEPSGPWPVYTLEPTPAPSESSIAAERHRFAPVPPVVPPLPQTLPSFTESFNKTAYQPPAPPASLFTAQHLFLFHHLSFSMVDCIMARGQIKVVLDIAIRHMIDAPYLIDQLLALAALHLAIAETPGESDTMSAAVSYRHQATELQTRAVSSFTRITSMVAADDTATCVPRFLFASILSLQVLAETLQQQNPPHHLQYHPSNDPRVPPVGYHHNATHFHGFIERMVECIHLHRGILTLIRPTWDYLMQSELNPLLRITHNANIAAITLSPGKECLPLELLIQKSSTTATSSATQRLNHSPSTSPTSSEPALPPLDPASAEACRGAIGRLQWAFDMHRSLPDQDTPHAPSGFIVTVPAEYVDVLRTHRPEALVILAYLGVLIHRCRGFWTFGDAGANLIRAITGYLGSRWRDALAWPLKVIETETDAKS